MEAQVMGIFTKKEHLPRIAYRQQRDGTKIYFVEVWSCYESGCQYSQESKETKLLNVAKAYLKKISDEEIVKMGVL